MLFIDMFNLPESGMDHVDSYLRIREMYRLALDSAEKESMRNIIRERYNSIKSKEGEINIPQTYSGGKTVETDKAFFAAIDKLNNDSGHDGCRSAASLLGDYLREYPDSIMGEVLLDIITEQFKGN